LLVSRVALVVFGVKTGRDLTSGKVGLKSFFLLFCRPPAKTGGNGYHCKNGIKMPAVDFEVP
jgi:hypothetical protein